MYYSKSTNGFYHPVIHGETIPADAVEITEDYHFELMQSQSQGKQIIADVDGYPVAIEPLPPVRSKVAMLAEVAAKRWQVETGGIIVSGYSIATDRESQAQLSSSYSSLKNGLITDTPWKTADGRFIFVTLVDLEPFAQAVSAHVQACFAAEQAHFEAIDKIQSQADLDAYDIDTGWPTSPL
ncbi:DUF4376 domain-containing protein [Aeromonas veronii]|uniref:DUF4376 domain-containing protein n=1 Tax=Aeromonas veronii TaxID=654 RepID=UPI003F671309